MKITKKRLKILATLRKRDGVNISYLGGECIPSVTGERYIKLSPDLHGMVQAGYIEVNKRGTALLTPDGKTLIDSPEYRDAVPLALPI